MRSRRGHAGKKQSHVRLKHKARNRLQLQGPGIHRHPLPGKWNDGGNLIVWWPRRRRERATRNPGLVSTLHNHIHVDCQSLALYTFGSHKQRFQDGEGQERTPHEEEENIRQYFTEEREDHVHAHYHDAGQQCRLHTADHFQALRAVSKQCTNVSRLQEQ